MDSFREQLADYCDIIGPARDLTAPFDLIGVHLPDSYLEVLARADGFITHNFFFRFFGTFELGGLWSAEAWNSAPWRDAYGPLLRDFVIVAEDIFGDQYGFCISEGQILTFAKLYCEGGRREEIPERDMMSFLKKSVLMHHPTAFDCRLATSAFDASIRPRISEHLAFRLPLICGGKYSQENLGVESATLHLNLLGQISQKNASVCDGTPISHFRVV